MQFVNANPNEFLVTGREGKVVNHGVAASAFLWPGSTCVLIPSTKQTATFEMTQESKDGIPLRFKGIVIYHVTQPELTASLFNFAAADGHAEIKTLISSICLGELRATVAHMTMQQCIRERKSTLTDAVKVPLQQIVEGQAGTPGWGIELDVVQVAQVFVVDNELRRQLEAEVRNQIRSTSDLSDIRLREEVKLAQVSSDRKIQQEMLAMEKERMKIAGEKMHLQKDLERDEVETETPVRLLQVAKQSEVLKEELEMRRLENQVRELEVQRDMLLERVKQDLRREILPVEQMPQVAGAVSQMFRGASLAFYGEASPLLTAIVPLLDLVKKTLSTSNGTVAPENKRE